VIAGLIVRMTASAVVAVTLTGTCSTPLIIRLTMESPEKKSCSWVKPKFGQPISHPVWRWVNERGLQVATGEATLARYEELNSGNFKEIEDMIPADGNILLVLRQGVSISEDLRAALVAPLAAAPLTTGILHEIAVEYGGAGGPDLQVLAAQAGMAPHFFINSHAAVEYTVAFLGFQPGFPYLRGLPECLHAPRRASPRVHVAAGSVAIGGAYCGIYPAGGPGGWQIIGRTAAVLFDPAREAPALLMPGDHVRFVPS